MGRKCEKPAGSRLWGSPLTNSTTGSVGKPLAPQANFEPLTGWLTAEAENGVLASYVKPPSGLHPDVRPSPPETATDESDSRRRSRPAPAKKQ